MQLTPSFTLEEMLRSDAAVRKDIQEQFLPPDEVVENLKALCAFVLQPLRNGTGKVVRVSSGYRCARVNKAIGGAPGSQHQTGHAADITVEGMTVEELFQFIIQRNFPYDQVIQEFDHWVHVSFSPRNRREKLRATKANGKTVYTKA